MSYRVRRMYESSYEVIDEDGDRVARVSAFTTGFDLPRQVNLTGPKIMPPAMARAVSRAMNRLANELEAMEAVAETLRENGVTQ